MMTIFDKQVLYLFYEVACSLEGHFKTQEIIMNQNQFSSRWNEEKVREVIDYYESQTEEEAVAEYEAA